MDMQHSKLVLFGQSSKERVEQALNDLRQGKGVLLIDKATRENEADLVFSAEAMSQEDMALMIRRCSGVVCLCLTHEQADHLELPYMVEDNTSLFQTPFTISIEAKFGVTTGLSAADRTATVHAACLEDKELIVSPGHIFPLRAHRNGVLGRDGHTEGSVDLMKLAGLKSQAVLCELMNDDGSMARFPEVINFAIENNFTVLSIEDLIHYRKFICDYRC